MAGRKVVWESRGGAGGSGVERWELGRWEGRGGVHEIGERCREREGESGKEMKVGKGIVHR